MRNWAIGTCALALTVAGCSASEDAAMMESVERVQTVDIAEAPGEAETDSALGAENATAGIDKTSSAPQIAYVYGYGFRIAPGEIAPLAQRHVELCEKLANNGCRVLSLQQSGSEGSYAYGTLELAVAASKARNFGKDLASSADSLGGEQVDTSISGEDLSKQIVDTEARLRARTLLRDRLMEVLRSRQGTVAELVEAERGVAQVNEEIDQARSWLAEMRGRVAYSRVTISYNSSARTGGSFGRPIVDAFQSIGSILGTTIAFMIYALTVLIPVILALLGLGWLWRKSGIRLFRRSAAKEAQAGDEVKGK
ncbi:DUF4349 domain-containing protein [Erythrobacter sp. W53]|uniref:DUF4349 domain-containing protein n=1 Tax=Erythrobacter sp. W53 TaxID=3425947 RepID=UPI003D7674BE